MRETRTAQVTLGDDGILIVRIRKGARHHLFTDEPTAIAWLHRYTE